MPRTSGKSNSFSPQRSSKTSKKRPKSRSKAKVSKWSPRSWSKSQVLLGALLVVLFALVGYRFIFSSSAAPANFVYRNGSQLMLNGSPYKFVGYNYFGATGCAHGQVSSATLDRYFSGLRPISTTRTWGFKAQGMSGIDATVASAEKYNQKLIIALGDGAQYCNDTGYDASFYRSGFRTNYLNWVTQVVSRHKNSPAVLGWETMNEPCHTGAGGVTRDDMRRFFDETAARIKQNDPNHLVFTGSLAPYDCGGQAMSDFAYVHGGPNIDGGSLHEYDYLSVGQRGASGHWNNVRSQLHGINKVAYVGEVGVGPDGGCLSDGEMSSAHKQKLDGYMNASASGVLVWGFDDQKVCGIYSGRQITFNDSTWNMFRNYTNGNLPAPNGSGTPTPTPTPTPPAPTPTPPSPTPTPTPPATGAGIVNDNGFTYSAGWSVGTGNGKYLNDDHYSSTVGASYSYRFNGAQVKVYAARAPHHGKVAYSIDGGAETTIDLYSAARADQQLVFTSPLLATGAHTLKARVTGSKNAIAAGTVVNADRLDVIAAPPVAPAGTTTFSARVNDNSFSYGGQWATSTGAAKYNSDDHYTAVVGATYSYSFTGRQALLFASKASHHGVAAVSVDGGAETMVDLYAANRQDQVRVYSSPVMTSGTHTLKVRVTGNKNPAASGAVINADRVDLYK